MKSYAERVGVEPSLKVAEIIQKHIDLDNMLDGIILKYFLQIDLVGAGEVLLDKEKRVSQFKSILDNNLSIKNKQDIFMKYIYSKDKYTSIVGVSSPQIEYKKRFKSNLLKMNHIRNIVSHGKIVGHVSLDEEIDNYRIRALGEIHKLDTIYDRYNKCSVEALAVICRYDGAFEFSSGDTITKILGPNKTKGDKR
jgi:hypothetical protein